MDHGRGQQQDDAPPAPIARDMAGVLGQFDKRTSTAQQKTDLVRDINHALQDPRTNPAIVGIAADLVLQGDVDHSELRRILLEVEQIRRGKGFRKEGGAGAFFLFKVRQWSAWPWPNGKDGK